MCVSNFCLSLTPPAYSVVPLIVIRQFTAAVQLLPWSHFTLYHHSAAGKLFLSKFTNWTYYQEQMCLIYSGKIKCIILYYICSWTYNIYSLSLCSSICLNTHLVLSCRYHVHQYSVIQTNIRWSLCVTDSIVMQAGSLELWACSASSTVHMCVWAGGCCAALNADQLRARVMSQTVMSHKAGGTDQEGSGENGQTKELHAATSDVSTISCMMGTSTSFKSE